MNGIFITGTDTGVGKTVATGLLAKFLLEQRVSVITQKWAQTGGGRGADIDRHLKLMGIKKSQIRQYLPYIQPYVFKFPGSPHLAARLEGKKIDPEKIKKSFRFLASKFDFVLVEGSGGVLVPFDNNRFLIDIARDLGLAVLIVAANKLGAINHTLLTIEAVKKRKMNLLGVVFNNYRSKDSKIILRDNLKILKL